VFFSEKKTQSKKKKMTSSTQRLQEYIDSLKAARLGNNYYHQHQNFDSSNTNSTSLPPPFRPEPRDMLELEFMDSLDQRMAQLEKNLNKNDGNYHYRNNNHQQLTIVSPTSPIPNNSSSFTTTPNSFGGSTLLQKIHNINNGTTASSQQQAFSSQRRGFMFNNANNAIPSAARAFHSSFVPATSLVFRITLPFLRSSIGTTTQSNPGYSGVNSECASFLVHVADLSQTGDDLLWHIVAQSRIRFPDLMQVGGFEWTPGAASSLCLFALSQEEATSWIDNDQSKGGSARSGGAFLHYDSATPLHRFAPIAKAIRKREELKLQQQSMATNSRTSISDAMARNIRELGPSVDVEVFVLLKSLVQPHELLPENLKKGLW
jgi:hypothetical protein